MNFANLDRRVVFVLVILALLAPLLWAYSVKPARMHSAETFFDIVKGLEAGEHGVAFVALDFGPNTKAENGPQAEVMIEHLMRRRIPIAFMSLYALAEPLLNSIPESVAQRLMKENPGEKWEYGKDWVNLGFRPGGYVIVQAIPKSENLVELFKKDSRGNNLNELPAFKNVKTLRDIKILVEFTGLVGIFGNYIQFFQNEKYRPIIGHGCTSITIPESYIYLDSGQIKGLLEGIAGAAWYSVLLKEAYPKRGIDSSLVINTGLGVAHLVIIFLVILGNLTEVLSKKRRAKHA